MSDSQVPPELLEAIEGDLRPVRPLLPPWRRALLIAAIAVCVLATLTTFWSWRWNLSALGPAWAWGVSIAQALLGLVVLGAALREAVPGRNLPRWVVATAIGGAAVVVVLVTFATGRALPATMPPGVWLRYAWECWGISMVNGLPLFAVATWLVTRALPTRPVLAGALCGLGVGVMADAATRLFCWVSTPSHVLLSHDGAIVTLMVAGALVTTVRDRWRGRGR